MTKKNTDEEIKRMLRKLHGPGGEKTLAQLCVERILTAMYPRFDEEWEKEGYEADAEGYVDSYEWEGADLIDFIAEALHMHGFGPRRDVLSGLNRCAGE